MVEGNVEMFQGDEHLSTPVSEWASQPDTVKAGTFIEVLVPMPQSRCTDAIDLVREGRKLLHEGDDPAHIDSALIRARKAIEPVRKKLRTAAGVARNAPTTRHSVCGRRHVASPKREAILIEALVSYVAGAAHSDAITKTFENTSTLDVPRIGADARLLPRHRIGRDRPAVEALLVIQQRCLADGRNQWKILDSSTGFFNDGNPRHFELRFFNTNFCPDTGNNHVNLVIQACVPGIGRLTDIFYISPINTTRRSNPGCGRPRRHGGCHGHGGTQR